MVSQIGYLLLVDAPATEYSTLMEVLMKIISIIDLLERQHCVLVFDKAVYTKIQQIRWKEQIFYDRFVVCLGEFHPTMCYLSAISRIFQEGGLKVTCKCLNFVRERWDYEIIHHVHNLFWRMFLLNVAY